jgi:AcrR family transcriptional regulator
MRSDERTEEAAPPLAQQLRAKRSEMMAVELETVALRLFHERGFAKVTVADIAGEASISARTFYRYFLAKEDVLQLQIDRRCAAIRDALWARPADEAPLHALRVGVAAAIATEDAERTRRWTEVIAATPEVVMGVLGGIVLKTQRAIAEFVAARLGLPNDALEPTVLAAAATGVIQAAQTQWLLNGGDLATTIAEGLAVLERGIGSDGGGREHD